MDIPANLCDVRIPKTLIFEDLSRHLRVGSVAINQFAMTSTPGGKHDKIAPDVDMRIRARIISDIEIRPIGTHTPFKKSVRRSPLFYLACGHNQSPYDLSSIILSHDLYLFQKTVLFPNSYEDGNKMPLFL